MYHLDPQNLELQGKILIEASAGTGKTYTIGHLFVRLLLEQELSVDQILVVTFTQAATEELRDRLRQRLRQALDAFNQEQDDALLQRLADNTANKKEAQILLTDALTRMDEAAIFTIHSFCQRMLQEHAFESGSPFTMDLLDNEQPLRQRVIEDFWRQHFYSASVERMAWITSLWKTPQDLLKALGSHWNQPHACFLPKVNKTILTENEQLLDNLFTAACTVWQDAEAEIIGLLESAVKEKRISSAKKKYNPTQLQMAIEAMQLLIARDHAPYLLPELLVLFTAGHIRKSLLKKAKGVAPEHHFFTLFEQLYKQHQKLVILRRSHILQTARTYLLAELARRKQNVAQLSFQDLLSHLNAALHGPGGQRLALSIGKRFPVIMVDEFQDTDPLQYDIFSTIHRKTPHHRLFLIGDPKQAVYGFRGADIFTYLQAREETAPDKRQTMTTNYRASTNMVAAVNHLFNRENAFLISASRIAFTPVQAAGLADKNPLLIDQEQPEPLQCLVLPETEKKSGLAKYEAQEYAACVCARKIAELLSLAGQDRALLAGHRLAAGDIAVLVRTHREAAEMRRALRKANVPSVYLSQNSVFDTQEARQLVFLLAAFADSGNSGLIRTALATELMGCTATELDDISHDEKRWEEISSSMHSYNALIQRYGFFTMFQQLLADRMIVPRILASEEGERKMTNFLHLADLLQEAGQELSGTDKLLSWLVDQIENQESMADNRQLRLESDENLVAIVTIHKAKGMEYPVVFLPFLWSARPCKQTETFSFHPENRTDQLIVDLGTGDDHHFQLAEKERLAEDMRLLYVAFTRAKYLCYYCLGKINKFRESALAHLLSLPAADSVPHQADIPWHDSVATYSITRPLQNKNLAAAVFSGSIDTSWQITSYSKLVRHHDPQPERPDYDQCLALESRTTSLDPFGFPKGAAAGTCLHTIFEKISFTDPANHEQIIATALENAGFDVVWQPVVTDWINDILHTEMDKALSLKMLSEKDKLNEMGFYFPLHSVNIQGFNQVLEQFSFAPLPENQGTLKGLMVGFIDLVFRHNGKYYLADYKSNYLGSHPDDYRTQLLQDAMLEHRYDLQYLIYTVALYRFLRQRIADFSYARHFGGVFYLFLRGMNPAHQPGTGIFSTRPAFELIDQLDQCCSA